MNEITLSKTPSQRLNIILDGQHCTISLKQAGHRMYLDLTVGANQVCAGAICVNRADIIQSPTPYFKGTLHFWDKQGDNAPHWSGLNGRFVLIFVPDGEELPESLRF